MVLFTILLITLICLAVFAVLLLGAGGAVFIVIFSDVIVCAAIIAFIMYLIVKHRRGR